MNNDLVKQKNWWNRNWKWLVPLFGIVLLVTGVLISSGFFGFGSDFAKAYADSELYENALKKAQSNPQVIELLGEIEPIDKLSILEGAVEYSNNDNTINSTISIKGSKGKAKMDLTADKLNNEWDYRKIDIRIKSPPEKKQTIEIIPNT